MCEYQILWDFWNLLAAHWLQITDTEYTLALISLFVQISASLIWIMPPVRSQVRLFRLYLFCDRPFYINVLLSWLLFTSIFTISGEEVLLVCPLQQEQAKIWFTDVRIWNIFLQGIVFFLSIACFWAGVPCLFEFKCISGYLTLIHRVVIGTESCSASAVSAFHVLLLHKNFAIFMCLRSLLMHARFNK